MASKRFQNITLVENPFIKKKNQEWTLDSPEPKKPTASIDFLTSGDHHKDTKHHSNEDRPTQQLENAPATADIEAGNAQVEDRLVHFSQILEKFTLSPYPDQSPHLPVKKYRELYNNNSGSSKGSHFIIHQHDHPVAGTHYDLRLQINETSSVSWAIMYGLPGDPNSVRLNRNATETRVHCLWNHLIETASLHTGSLLIWDTGTYTILPRRSKHAPAIDPDSERSSSSPYSEGSRGSDEEGRRVQSDRSRPHRRWRSLTEQEKLHRAFADRKIRLQLHGTRLPETYVLNLRLTRSEDVAGRQRSKRSGSRGAPRKRRRRGVPEAAAAAKKPVMTSSDEDGEVADAKHGRGEGGVEEEDDEHEDVEEPVVQVDEELGLSALEKELRELEDEEVRRTNAYTGADNTIGSVHQRRWYLSLDREACGFTKRHRSRHEGIGRNGKRVEWLRKTADGKRAGKQSKQEDVERNDGRLEYPFYVRGVAVERSVVTGRRGADILRDEGVVDHVNRQGWKAVLN